MNRVLPVIGGSGWRLAVGSTTKQLGRLGEPSLPMSGGSEFEMKSDLPSYPFGSSPRALIAGKEPFHPPFKGWL
jgi:hypothetical protein